MRTLWKISTFTVLLFTLTACMPDSLTKFKEAPTKNADETTSSSGGSSDSDDSSTCTAGTEPACSSPGTFTYPSGKNYKFLIYENGEEFETPLIVPTFSSYIVGHEEYLSIEPPTNFTSETGLIVDPEEDFKFTGEPDRFLPKTFYDITATYSTPELSSDEVMTDTIAFTIAKDLESLIYPMIVGSQVILEVDSVTPFSTATGYNYISAENGVSGLITYIDTNNKELHITISENTGQGFFSVDGEVDNSTSFFSSKATVSAVYNTYARSTSIQSSLSPTVLGYQTLSSNELASISYSIFPSLPAGLSFDQMRGTIGTLRAYQNVTDGSMTVAEGSRTITGTGTLFLSHLQVNSTIELNGELHKIESIESNSVANTYTPFSATASVSSFKKILKGSVSTVNGSPTLTGTGTAFSSEVITSKNIVIDAVSDFTGLNASISSVGSDTSITLNSNFTGTDLTIPELKATSYVVTAKNILGKTVTRLLTISLLDIVQPKTLSKVAYNLAINDKVVLYADEVTAFSKGGYISNRSGTIAQIDYIDTANKKIFATVKNIGNYCTVETALTSTACTNANGYWINKNFDLNDPVDNASSYLAGETTLVKDSVLSFSISSNAISRLPVVSPSLSAAELATLEYSIDPDISSGQGFCDNAIYTNEFDCTANGGNWSQGLLFATSDQCSTQNAAHSSSALCTGAGGTWIEKGSFYGAPTTAIPETEFTITTTTLLDKTIDSTLSISVNAPPAGLSITRNVLLHVPSSSAFEVGDAISSNSGGLGTITGKFKINATDADKNTFLYEFLEVKVTKGSFNDFDDLDNLLTFDSQKTYILGDGAYPYNLKLNVADSSQFKDPYYPDYIAGENLLQVGGSDRARIAFNDEVNNTIFVTVYDTQTYAVNVEPTSLATSDTITAPNISGTPSTTISSMEGNHLILQFSSTAYLGLSSTAKGYDITSAGTGIGMLHYFDATNTARVEVTEGTFNTTEDLDAISPHSGDNTELITNISNDYTLYFYRGVEGSAYITLDVSTDSTVIELDKELPAGLVAEENTNGIFRITGTPTSPSNKEKFTLTASNAFGATTYEFFIKVYNQINIIDTTGSTSYILHKTGKGNGRKPCAITEEQMSFGDAAVRDISCFLDVGENELHSNGIKLEFQMGENLCQFVDEKPYAFWRFPPGNSYSELGNPTIYKHSGYDACTSNAPTADYTTDAAGTTSIAGFGDPRIRVTIEEPADLCMFNHDLQRDDIDFPKCDTGEYPRLNVTWEAEPFVCSVGGIPTGDSNYIDCEENNGSCDAGGGEENKGECDDSGGTWTTNATHNDAANGGGDTPAMGECLTTDTDTVENFDCGGETYNCISGARKTWRDLDDQDLLDGATTIEHNMSVGNPKPTKIEPDYTDGYTSSDFGTNVYYSNYRSLCSADSYKPDVTTFESSIGLNAPHDSTDTSHFGPGATSTYEFKCKDSSGTTTGRIRIVVRDFDRKFKVKIGFCSNPAFTSEDDCITSGGTWGQSGIDYFNPDSVAIPNGSSGTNDPLNYLFNTQMDGFGTNYNIYDNNQDFETGGTCSVPTFDFGTVNSAHPEDAL